MFGILRDTVSEKQACWTNPALNGVRWRGGWNLVQKTVDGAYDWSGSGRRPGTRAETRKTAWHLVCGANGTAQGLEAAGCKFVQLSYGKIPWINDPVFMAKWKDFIKLRARDMTARLTTLRWAASAE